MTQYIYLFTILVAIGLPFLSYANWKEKYVMPQLTDIQQDVTQNNGTEQAFNNAYWNNKEPGIYVDITTGEPLFSSIDKYKSGTGWPSFTKAISSDSVVKKADYSMIWPRTELRSKSGDIHLGHLFNDGPKEKGGKRFCINSAALKFVHKNDLVKAGYEKYLARFKK